MRIGIVLPCLYRYHAGIILKYPGIRQRVEGAAQELVNVRFDAMVRQGIMAYEMDVTSLTGISKLSQNKPLEAIEGVRAALSKSDDAQARALGLMMVQEPKPQS